MKIAFVSTFFTSSILPLMKHLTERGNQTDLYIFSKQTSVGEGCLTFESPILGNRIKKLTPNNQIFTYLYKSSHIFTVPYYTIKNRKYLIGFIPYLKNYAICKKLVTLLHLKKYDYIYINVNEEHEVMLCKLFNRYNLKHIIIAYHEVLVSHIGKPKLKKVVADTFNLGFPLVTYSQHTKKQLKELTGYSDIHVVPFGPFEIYKTFKTDFPIIAGTYILCIGSILSYKGLSYLYDTINDVIKNPTYKVVIAGHGNDPVLEKIRNDGRFTLINRFVSECEFANLIRFAKCIVCPYVAGSQSGIPVSAMALGTPVVSTNVGAFPELIENGKNGYLVAYGDKNELAEAILKIMEGKFVNKYVPSKLEWENICVDFENMLTKSKL